MAMQDALRNGESQTAAASPSGNHGVEQGFAQRLRNAGTVVDYGHFTNQAVAFRTQGELTAYPGAQQQAWHLGCSCRHRLHGITRYIEYGLNHLRFIPGKSRQARDVVALDRQPGSLGQQQCAHPLQHRVDVERLGVQTLAWPQHAVDQITQTVRLFNNNARELLQARIIKVAFEQLGSPTNPAQWILDLMRQAPR